MEELIKRLERVIATGAPDKDGQHPISAETVLEVVKGMGMSYRKHLMTSDEPPSELYKAAEVGTNLAEVGTDCISRQAAIDTVNSRKTAEQCKEGEVRNWTVDACIDMIKQLPPAQPEIIRCRNCKFASGDSRICMKFGHSPIGELDFCSFAERREVTT